MLKELLKGGFSLDERFDLPRLEKAVLDSEQRRETRVDQISTALTALVAQLQREVVDMPAQAPHDDGRILPGDEQDAHVRTLPGVRGDGGRRGR